MLKRTIEFVDYDGEKKRVERYFAISQPEWLELEVEFDAGMSGLLQNIIDTNDSKRLVAIFKRLVKMSIGNRVMDDDGTLRFVKTDDVRERFCQTAAYNTLFMELATDDKAAVAFIEGILPAEMMAAAKEQADQDKPVGAPSPQPVATPANVVPEAQLETPSV